MTAYQIIRKKRNGQLLTAQEIRWFLEEYTQGDIPDYQMSALLMAIFFRGLSPAELSVWTEHMLHSGQVIDLSALPGPKIDKHSTGGVGDKVSLILAPAVAIWGVKVPMISGRGLGHTGGTLDKLESIPGFTTGLSVERFTALLEEVGVVIGGQTEEITPADRKLYALRDVTATVDSIPLIASSIMSKKIAEGIDGLVLDVKTGSGAFMDTREKALELARTMVAIGQRMGKQVRALITDMNQPLGRMVGNALEVRESIQTLRGEGPEDLETLVVELGAHMLGLGGVEENIQRGRDKVRQGLHDGRALKRFQEMVVAQGGDGAVVDRMDILPAAPHQIVVEAPAPGVVTAVDTEALGRAAILLGAGRMAKEDDVDPAVGLEIHGRLGDAVEGGAPLFTIHGGEVGIEEARDVLTQAITLGERLEALPPLIYDVIA